MQRFKKSKVAKLLVLMLVLLTVAALGGCKGSDGSNGVAGLNGTDGATGATGATGPTGAPGPVTDTADSCMICHTTDKVEDIGIIHPDPTNDNLIITVQGVNSVATGTVAAGPGGFVQVNFSVQVQNHTTGALSSLTTITAGTPMSVKLASLIPASTGTNTWSTDYWEMTDAETPGAAASGVNPATNNIDVTSAATGSYSYTTVLPFGAAWPGYNNADYALGTSMRVAIELSNTTALAGLAGLSGVSGFNRALPGIMDFTGDPGVGNAATAIASVRQFVVIQACRQCHGPLMDGAAHANNRNDIRECDFCHSALYGSAPKHLAGFMADDNADLPVFIHGIHGSTWTDTNFDPTNVEFAMGPNVTNPVTYPQELKNCTVCHSVPVGQTAPGDLTELDNWKTHPTGRVCHSCHTDNVITGATSTLVATMTHDATGIANGAPATSRTDAQCAGCHVGTGDSADIVNAHSTAATGNDIPEYTVTISAPPYSNGSYYVSGETFTVDVTLATNGAVTQTPVPEAYTDAQDAAYNSGNGLAVATLYMYGPRSFAKSILPGGGQGVSLFGKGDATGFHYGYTVPAGLTPGTYLIRVRIADYSWSRSNPNGGGAHVYQAESFALAKIQIGTATEQNKVDGQDSCIACHGDTLMHGEDHASPFDTDHCTACHDQSGGHAAYIGNRVHAVHAHSSTGDMVDNRDWNALVYELGRPVIELAQGPTVTSPVTFPLGDISPATNDIEHSSTYRCVICHKAGSTSGTYKTNAYETPCLGCHGDVPAATDHMRQNGGDYQ
jgi:Outer membrane cytochrome MtrC/MtrF-like, domains II/IV